MIGKEKNGCKEELKPFKMNSNQQPMIACMPFVISPIQRILSNSYIVVTQVPNDFRWKGAESLVPLLALILDKSAEMGAQRCMVGMAHRGRLNVLANIFNKPIRYILDDLMMVFTTVLKFLVMSSIT